MRMPNRFLALGLTCLLPCFALAQAPVVEDSDHFAVMNEQQAANLPPVAKAPVDYDDTEDDIALAHDNDADTMGGANLLNKLKGMQQEIQELRGQLEVQSHELALLKQQQKIFYGDIDARLRSKPATAGTSKSSIDLTVDQPIEGIQANATPKTPTAPVAVRLAFPPNKNPADEQISYLAAYDLVKSKRFDEALSAMQSFVLRYPHGGYTANAQYWLGELYMVQKNYPKAIQHFEIVLKHFPTSSKAAPCSLKIGYALASSGKKAEAKQRLQQVLINFPDTPTAQLAATKLMSINAS